MTGSGSNILRQEVEVTGSGSNILRQEVEVTGSGSHRLGQEVGSDRIWELQTETGG